MTISEINRYDNSSLIFEYYAPGCLKKSSVKSPISKDEKASFSVFYSKKYNKLMFKDHRGYKGDALGLIQEIKGLSASDALKEAILILGNNKVLGNKINIPDEQEYKTTFHENILTNIEFCDFKPNDLKWFENHMIDLEVVLKENIKNIAYYKTLYIEKISTVNRRMFFYDYSLYEKGAYKIYETNPKWFLAYYQDGNKIIDGLFDIRIKYLKEGKLPYIILIHGKKNYLVLKSLKYNVVARQSENPISIDLNILNELKTYTDNLVLFADNDFDKLENWGILMAKEIKKQTNVDYKTYPTDLCMKANDSDIAGIAKYLKLNLKQNEIHNIITNMLYNK